MSQNFHGYKILIICIWPHVLVNLSANTLNTFSLLEDIIFVLAVKVGAEVNVEVVASRITFHGVVFPIITKVVETVFFRSCIGLFLCLIISQLKI